MAMYIGTGKYLRENYPFPDADRLIDDTHYIIEAIGSGIQIIPLSLLALHNDYISALRPRFSPEKISRSIGKVLRNVGKSYDYSFNFYSDMNYVCSTLVTKAYLPEDNNSE
jgi:uncharacterized protein YycO